MPNPILPKRSFTANAVPLVSDVSAEGELLVNWTDGKLFTKRNGQIVTINAGGGGGSSPSVVSAATVAGFPATGSASNIYVATDSRKIFGWDATNSVYVELGPVGGGSQSLQVTIPGSGDQFWSDTLLLLKGDGNLTDSGPTARSVTAYGNAAATTSTSKYGTGCLSFDGASGSYMALPQSSDWALTGSWTIEGWAYITSTGTAGLLTTMIADTGLGADGSLVIAPEGCWIFARDFASNNQLSWTLPTNAWAHFAFVSDAGTLRAYVNGVQASSMTQTIALTSQKLWLGSRFYDLQQYNFAGKLDDIRITKACRYPNGTTFTPPTATYVTGPYTAPVIIPCLPAT